MFTFPIINGMTFLKGDYRMAGGGYLTFSSALYPRTLEGSHAFIISRHFENFTGKPKVNIPLGGPRRKRRTILE